MKSSIFIFLILRLSVMINGRRLEGISLAFCHLKCSLTQFNCNCERSDWHHIPATCIARSALCDGWSDCDDGSDEIECQCPSGQFQCGCDKGGNCLANAIYECQSISGNRGCMSTRNSDGQCTISPKKRCDSVINCPWEPTHDEQNCTICPVRVRPNPCRCNTKEDMSCSGGGFTCYRENGRCNQLIECSDTSDEVGCSCPEGKFRCQCYRKDPVICPSGTGCISLSNLNNGVKDCHDGSDETPFLNSIESGNGPLTVWRLNNSQQCMIIENCNPTSCFTTPSLQCIDSSCNSTEVICVSNYSKNAVKANQNAFQCADGSLAMTWQFCDNAVDCADDSDEVRNRPGFKCIGQVGNCVVPQRNLYDDIPHCIDESDLCFDGIHKCYQCLDKRLLISSRQVCDGVMDCYDLSDECLCDGTSNFSACPDLLATYTSSRLLTAQDSSGTRLVNEDIRFNYTIYQSLSTSLVQCTSKWGVRMAVMCDGRPECRDFSDECNCENPPTFCRDACHSFYPLGDRYCDGTVDEVWKFINDSDCPKGFDEVSCPQRFRCNAGAAVSIDVLQKCDGIKNCDDGSDELKCAKAEALEVMTSIPTTATTSTASYVHSTYTVFSVHFFLLYCVIFDL